MTQNFQKKLKDYKKKFDSLFLKNIPRKPFTLWRPVIYHFKTGGKRWRPFLVRQVAKLYKISPFVSEPLEVVVELTHNWTLIHDDIEDGDILRRGKSTCWKKFGLDYGINCGDAMFALSFEILNKNRKIWSEKNTLFLFENLAATLKGLAEGQNLEFDFRKTKGNIEISDYMGMVKKKTSLLPKFGVTSITKIAKVPQSQIKALEKFCDFIFPAFQIKDDILNLTAKKDYGKEIGGDIKEGKRTILVIHLLNHLPKKEKNRVLKILLKRGEKVTKKEVQKIINLMKKKGSIEFTSSFAQRLIEKAKKPLFLLPNLPERKILQDIIDWLAKERTY